MSIKSKILAVIIGAPALMLAACSSSSNSPSDGGTGGTIGKGGAAGNVATGGAGGAAGATATGGAGGASSGPPALGTQIDRLGRPAINTAITDPFDANATTHGSKEDMYNASTLAAAKPTFEAAFEANLAILDGLDMVCGNQFAADKTKTDATRYQKLADVFLDDQLYVDTSSATCTTYLGVEANATGIIPNTDCGGRTLTEDVIDESYSLLAIGMTSGVTDGVNADDHVAAQTAAFPFLAPPN
jgi:hypothetical protein